MNSLGFLAHSAYTGTSNSVYGPPPSRFVDKAGDSDEKKTANQELDPQDINDEAIISDEAKLLFAQDEAKGKTSLIDEEEQKIKKQINKEFSDELTIEEKQVVSELKARDAEVKAHEQAHIAAAAGLSVSAPSYSYQTGPDGKKYAVGGEVSISFVGSSDPQKNIENAQKMKAAAMAPANPSSQDRAVAQNADKIIAQSQKELAEQVVESLNGNQKPTEERNIVGDVQQAQPPIAQESDEISK